MWPRVVKRFFLVLFCFGLGGVGGLAAVFYHYAISLPAIGPLLEGYDPPETTRILSRDGTVIGELFVERRTVVPIKRIPKVMLNAVIASEDADFRRHKGLDYMGIARAIYTNLVRGRLSQGGSTITQQVARTFFLTPKKTYERKIREMLLTKRIEERLTKDEILFLYLNQINFGHARYGVSEAARYYFGKDIEEITLAEASLLAGIPKAPTSYSPITHPEAAKKRRVYVLGEMEKLKMISAAEAKAAAMAPIDIVKTARIDHGLAPEVVSYAVESVREIVDLKTLKQGGYTIETTIDTALQRAARQVVVKGLEAIDTRHGRVAPYKRNKQKRKLPRGALREGRIYWSKVVRRDREAGVIEVEVGDRRGYIDLTAARRYNPKKLDAGAFAEVGAKLRVSLASRPREGKPLELRLEMGPQAALVAIRPHDGSIAAMIGGDRVRPGGFNRATKAKRQPGSTFKPLPYLAAIQTGRYTTATLLDDAPETHGEWQPQNAHEEEFLGAVRLREALARSLNLPSVKLITDIGPEMAVALAHRMGVTSKLEPVPALALGASAVTPLEMAAVYAVLANRGVREPPRVVQRIIKPDGTEIPLVSEPSAQVVSEQEAYIMTSLLKSVVQGGTGARAMQLKRPAAGKTGTSDDQRDAWFVGYTPDFACAVWVGYDDYRSIGAKEYGSRAALPIWTDFMTRAHEGHIKRDFAKPDGIVTLAIDPQSGLLAFEGLEGAINEVFIDGTEPAEVATPPDLISPESFLMGQMAGADAGTEPTPAGTGAPGPPPKAPESPPPAADSPLPTKAPSPKPPPGETP
jgi:penicillin-binding protein 1A